MKNKGLHFYAVCVACAGFLLVIAGGLVTSTGSGLSVPDWPLSFHRFFPPMVGGVRFEHTHRVIAGAVAILTMILAVGVWLKESSCGAKWLAGAAVAAVVAQALLGGLTVLLHLPPLVSVAHATLGQVFFSLLVCLAVITGPLEPADVIPDAVGHARKLQRLAKLTTGLIFLQLIAGAILRHTGERWALHLHLFIALAVTVHIILLARRVLRNYSEAVDLARPALALMSLLGIQLVLGFYSWRLGGVPVTTAHVAVGALILATSSVLTMQSFRALVIPA